MISVVLKATFVQVTNSIFYSIHTLSLESNRFRYSCYDQLHNTFDICYNAFFDLFFYQLQVHNALYFRHLFTLASRVVHAKMHVLNFCQFFVTEPIYVNVVSRKGTLDALCNHSSVQTTDMYALRSLFKVIL